MANEYGMRAIQTITLTNSSTAAISFTSIPQTYKHLMIIANLNSQGASNNVVIKFNGSSTSYGANHRLGGNNTSTYADTFSATGGGILGGTTSGSSTNTSAFGTHWIFIPNYSSTSLHKFVLGDGGPTQNMGDYHNMASGRWENTSAITQVDLSNYGTFPNFTSGSTATLYGIEGVETVITPKATGGRIWYDGTYIIHQFTASGTFTPSQNLTADILCVAGGGGAGGNGGGGWPGGGGGAGGYRYLTAQSLTSGTAYSITVAGGGSGGSGGGTGQSGSQGSNSSFSPLVSSTGGGYGGGGGDSSGTNGSPGGSGGSGGGGSSDSDSLQSGGAGTAGQGFAGSAGVYQPAGGGGSATQIGKNSPFGTPGAINSITGGPVEYARGGGGGTGGSDPGTSLTPSNPTWVHGKINTGNGGNGGHAGGASGKNGGSGVVIVRYLAV